MRLRADMEHMAFYKNGSDREPPFLRARRGVPDGTQPDGVPGPPAAAESGEVLDEGCTAVLDGIRPGGVPHSMSKQASRDGAGEGSDGAMDGRRRADVSDARINHLRESGASWAAIGRAVGLSRSGARQRWLAINGQARARDGGA